MTALTGQGERPTWHASAGCRAGDLTGDALVQHVNAHWPDKGAARQLGELRAMCAACPTGIECTEEMLRLPAHSGGGIRAGLTIRSQGKIRAGGTFFVNVAGGVLVSWDPATEVMEWTEALDFIEHEAETRNASVATVVREHLQPLLSRHDSTKKAEARRTEKRRAERVERASEPQALAASL